MSARHTQDVQEEWMYRLTFALSTRVQEYMCSCRNGGSGRNVQCDT